MALQQVVALPALAPFPEAGWIAHMAPEEWTVCLDAWTSLAEAYLCLTPSEFEQMSAKDESVTTFLVTYMAEIARSPSLISLGDLGRSKALRQACFFLSNRILGIVPAPERLLTWDFLANVCKVYGKAYSTKLVATIWAKSSNVLEKSLAAFKTSLARQLEAGIEDDAIELEKKLKQLNHLLHVSPETATLFMSGSDFLDALASSYKFMKPPLRKTIISTTYLSLVGVINRPDPNISLLTDQLFALSTEARAQKASLASTNDALVIGLVSETPILKKILQRAEKSGTGLGKVKSVITMLKSFRTTGKHRLNKRIDKGKGISYEKGSGFEYSQIHVHRMSLISQIQELFPDLGSGFIFKLLDEYSDDVERVISHLLELSLPPHLEQADRTEKLGPTQEESSQGSLDIAPRQTPPLLPNRHNVFDGDEFDLLSVDMSRIHFGRRDPDRTADEMLKDRSNAPNKAAILSALAAFDSDDDERDDTYDIGDVGGTVDSANPGNELEESDAEGSKNIDEVLFKAFNMSPGAFDRDAATRRSKQRIILKEETGMTDEAIEGWALMLLRDPQRMRRLKTESPNFSMNDESDSAGKRVEGGHRGHGRGGRGGRSGRGGCGGGNVSGAANDKDTKAVRQRKGINKESRANHNRRDQRAKKMGRADFN